MPESQFPTNQTQKRLCDLESLIVRINHMFSSDGKRGIIQ